MGKINNEISNNLRYSAPEASILGLIPGEGVLYVNAPTMTNAGEEDW